MTCCCLLRCSVLVPTRRGDVKSVPWLRDADFIDFGRLDHIRAVDKYIYNRDGCWLIRLKKKKTLDTKKGNTVETLPAKGKNSYRTNFLILQSG